MQRNRKRRALLAGCVALAIVVLGNPARIAAQSRPAKAPAKQRGGASAHKAVARADVDRFRALVDTELAKAGPDKGAWGVLVADAATGEVLYSRNPDSYFMPASDAKLFTTAFALGTLGPEFRVRTIVGSNGALDAAGMLRGNLVLVGAGDANLSNRKFPFAKKEERDGPADKALAEFADAVVAHGVKEISGDVIANDSRFEHELFPSGWLVDDMLWSYGAAVSAIVVNDNTFTVDLRPGARDGDPARPEPGATSDYYTIENVVTTGSAGSEEKLAATHDPGSRLIRLSGTMPLDAPARRLTFGVEEPAESAAVLLARLLKARGVKIDGEVRARHAGDPQAADPVAMVLAERASVPLADEIRLTNKNSENVHAELLLLLAAHERAGANNYEDALKVEANFFKAAGIADGDVVLSDGSGLSRKDLVTPRAVVQILRYASAQPWGELYRSTLPQAGEDGTLSDRMKNTRAAGRVFAKTGTIGHGNALSGYATTVRGERILFSILGNNNNLHAQDANKVIDAICAAIVEEVGVPANTAK